MYKVLVVDDEPIILSGIRFLIDWEAEDCSIIATARNGQDAYNIIKEKSPDIVITDIKMPVMDGLELLKLASKNFPDVSFIMLTSLEEFKLAKEAIKYNACDYLLKTELEPEILKTSLKRAKERLKEKDSTLSFEGENNKKVNLIPEIIKNFLVIKDIPIKDRNLLEKSNILNNYVYLGIFIDYPASSFETSWKDQDFERLFNWEGDIINRIVPSSLHDYYPVTPIVGKRMMYIFFISNVEPGAWPAIAKRITDKIHKASEMVTGLKTTITSTRLYSSKDSLEEARTEFEASIAKYYLEKSTLNISSLDIDAMLPKVERDIIKMDLPSLKVVANQIINSVSSKDHYLNQIEFAIKALYSVLHGALSKIGALDEDRLKEIFASVQYITRRSGMVQFLSDVFAEVGDLVSAMRGSNQSEITDRARSYILEHITEHISLSDVADYANVSPGYMSQFFKKNMKLSLVDYINQMKVNKAKEIMNKGNIRINDLASSLGYDNIYYFSKVFKKQTGITPTEYMKNKEEKND